MKTLDAALAYHEAGLSVLPVRLDGTKAPLASRLPMLPDPKEPSKLTPQWQQWVAGKQTKQEVQALFKSKCGLAVIGGHGLEIIDFDLADRYPLWADVLEAIAPGLLARLPVIKTPNGYHVYIRSESPQGNQKLAMTREHHGNKKSNVAIETRGTGGYVIAPPSPAEVHPSKVEYKHMSGPAITETPLLTTEERDAVMDAARSLNEVAEKTHEAPHPPTVAGQKRPGDDYEARVTWPEILQPHGWSVIRQRGDVIHWQRPGKDGKGISATTGHCGDKLYVFSSNAAPFDNSRAYGKFNAYGLLNHGGDYKAAAKALKAGGFGEQQQLRHQTVRADEAPFPNESDAPPDLAPKQKADALTVTLLEELMDNDPAAIARHGMLERIAGMRNDQAEWMMVCDLMRRKKKKAEFNAAIKQYDAKTKMAVATEGWRSGLKYKTKSNGDITLDKCVSNLALIVNSDSAWAGSVRLNLLSNKITTTEGMPIDRNHKTSWADSDTIAAKVWLEDTYDLRPSTNDVNEAITHVATKNAFNPLTDYLSSLESHDKEMLDTWLIDFFGVEDTIYTRAVGRRWMISAVARALDPGCKADCVLILEGDQGMKKSSVFAQLCPDAAWFTDCLSDVGSKDQKEEIEGKWIVELGELKEFSKSWEQVKAFTSRTHEKYRPSYARFTIDSPRTCVFAGTINPDNTGYLRDVTGNRRFWPVKCRKVASFVTAQVRDMLWAEARDAYLAGVGRERDAETKWWIDPNEKELQAAAEAQQGERVEMDVWHDRVEEYVRGRDDISVSEVMAYIGIEMDKRQNMHGQRIGRILKMLRWEKYRSPLPGRPWRYRPPGTQLDLVA